jgi:hypothetical protein
MPDISSVPHDDPVCHPVGQPVRVGHSWQRKWNYDDPPQPTDQKICNRCHLTSKLPWVPHPADFKAISEWLDAPV